MELKIEYLKKEDLKPYANNAKIHTAEQIEQIKRSIEEFGFNDPIAVWQDNEIVEGHGRLLAVMEMDDVEKVPVIRLDGLDDEQRRAYMLVHNKINMNTGFDLELLAEELADIDIDMGEFGFELNDYDESEEVKEDRSEGQWFDNKTIREKIVENWQTFSLKQFVDNIMDEATAMYQFNRLCQGYNDGYNISLLFNPHRLETKTINNGRDILYGFNSDQKYREQFARFLIETQNKCVVPSQYYRFIAIGTAGYQYVNEFQPYLLGIYTSAFAVMDIKY